LPESAATPESVFLDRRRLLKAAAAGSILVTAPAALVGCDSEEPIAVNTVPDPSAHLYPVERNDAFKLDRALTAEEDATTYTNYYEFGSSKNIHARAQALPIRPWTVAIGGLVEKPMEIAIDDLLARMPLEERLYRHRCVEAWSMAVPWSGFPMRALVEMARPLSDAKYVKMTTFQDTEVALGQRESWYPWPYVEGLTIEEATNELAFLATGFYGKAIPKQNGAPLRLAVPWKYGFKSIKGIVAFEFTKVQPTSFWEQIQPREYGFWANVNPKVPHPRWSQATERVLGTGKRVPTQLFNGYAEQVADLYKGMSGQRLFT
jgi:sulfoxide reductase catalytic subunit YedY